MTSAKRIQREELQDKNDHWDKYPLKKTLKYISKDRQLFEVLFPVALCFLTEYNPKEAF